MGTSTATASPAEVARRLPGRPLRGVSRDWVIRIVTFVALLAVWSILSLILPRVSFSSPVAMIQALVTMLQNGDLADAWGETFSIMIIALSAAAVSGVTLGILFGRFRRLDQFFEPVLTAVFMTPKVALLPLIALWLGFQDPAKIVVVFLFSFFEIFFTVRNGVRTIDAEYVEVARAYSIPERLMLQKVILPATVPYVITGLRLGLLHGMVGVVLAGFFLENNGIGGLIFDAGGSFRVPQLFAALLTVAAVGLLISLSIRWVERRAAPWKQGLS
jgi:sulfonate transport system permease protein